MRILIGTSGYGYKEWKGPFYPPGMKHSGMLSFYAGRFSSVEINNTFYRIPSEQVILNWVESVPVGFTFAVKGPGKITHRKRLKNIEDDLAYFLKTIDVFGPKLGVILWQLHPSMKLDMDRFPRILTQLPSNLPCAFQLQHESWRNEEVFAMLRERNYAVCNVDTDDSQLYKLTSTADFGYLRLRKTVYTDDDLKRIHMIILEQSWTHAFIFFKHEKSADGVTYALKMSELVGTDAEH